LSRSGFLGNVLKTAGRIPIHEIVHVTEKHFVGSVETSGSIFWIIQTSLSNKFLMSSRQISTFGTIQQIRIILNGANQIFNFIYGISKEATTLS